MPELEIYNYDINIIAADIAVPKSLIDQLIKIHGNALLQKSLGINGDWTFQLYRLIPIEHNDDKELEKIKIDDNDPGSIIDYTKHIIRILRPECELTDIQLKLWDLVPRENPNDSEKYPFKTYNPTKLKKIARY